MIVLIGVSLHCTLGLIIMLFTPHWARTHRRIAKPVLQWIMWSLGIRLCIKGMEHIPAEGPLIIMANHASNIDFAAILIGIVPIRHFQYIVKKSLIWAPFLGIDMLIAGDFFIDRKHAKSAHHSMKIVRTKLEKGKAVLLFPEGTRSRDGTLGTLKYGGFKLAVESGIPIVPCYVKSSGTILPKSAWLSTPGSMSVEFFKPLHVRKETHKKQAKDAMKDLAHRITPYLNGRPNMNANKKMSKE